MQRYRTPRACAASEGDRVSVLSNRSTEKHAVGAYVRDGEKLLKFDYYVDESDPDFVMLCRQDGSLVAVFSAQGATWEGIVEAAEDDYRIFVEKHADSLRREEDKGKSRVPYSSAQPIYPSPFHLPSRGGIRKKRRIRKTQKETKLAAPGADVAGGPSSAYWLIAKNDDGPVEVLTIDLEGQEALPIFSFREEAEMFVWLEAGGTWSARETSVRELASLLFGLYLPYVKKVALDPLPEICDEGMVPLVSVSRNDFARTLLDDRELRGTSTPGSTGCRLSRAKGAEQRGREGL